MGGDDGSSDQGSYMDDFVLEDSCGEESDFERDIERTYLQHKSPGFTNRPGSASVGRPESATNRPGSASVGRPGSATNRPGSASVGRPESASTSNLGGYSTEIIIFVILMTGQQEKICVKISKAQFLFICV